MVSGDSGEGRRDGSSPFLAVLHKRLNGYGDRPLIEFQGAWYTGTAVTALADSIAALLKTAGVPPTAGIGVVMRNRPAHAAAVLGFVATERSFSTLYAMQSPSALAKDVERLGLAAVVADSEDWSAEVIEAARRAGTAGVAVNALSARLVEGIEKSGDGPFETVTGEPSIGILTSGTTGPPKRISVPMRMLYFAASSASVSQDPDGPDRPDLVTWAFSGIGGICQLMAAGYAGHPVVLLEKPTVPEWVAAVKRYRIKRVGVVPATIRMILDAGVPKEDLASLELVFGGSGPLERETRERFERTYDVEVVWGYGATEFAGTIVTWNPELYRRYGRAKPDSVGKPVSGVTVRVVDIHSGLEVPPDGRGYLEARVPALGPKWIRTYDLASIDSDGFVTLHGRGDGAINRGGFKVLPESVQRVLNQHPGVRDSAVVGIPDARLGEVPFAAVEPAVGAERPTEHQLRSWVREHLPAHHVPVRIRVVDELPRTATMKIRLVDVRALAS